MITSTYKEFFFFSGKISVNVAGDWFYPLDNNKTEDIEAAQAALLFQVMKTLL